MSDSFAKENPSLDEAGSLPKGHGWARKAVFRRLERLASGRIVVAEGQQSTSFGQQEGAAPLEARIRVHNPRFYARVALKGGVGAAESYMDGDWTCDDLPAPIRIMIRNRAALEGMEGGLARLALPARRLYHWLRRNKPAGSRANIQAHYDLGNDFYRLFLDKTMTYSSGIFPRPGATLEEASITKYDRICRKLGLSAKDHVVEIGTGWGGFAAHAAANYGCRVTTTTISKRQFEYAKERIEKEGLTERITLMLEDYRNLRGAFDKLISIEMIEAVGHQYLKTFFRRCGELLTPEGRMALQAITIEDQRYARHVRSVDFIKRYIFPGSCLVSVTAMSQAATAASDLRLVHLEDITPHYVETLKRWRERFLEQADAVRNLGLSDRFIRMWEYYLCYCEGAFAERYIGDVQAVFQKPLCRETVPLPAMGEGPPGASPES